MSNTFAAGGFSGSIGTSGPSFNIDDIKKRYKHRFNIEYYFIPDNSFMPMYRIVDNMTGFEYKFKPSSMINIVDDFENYLNELIQDIRNDKINNIIE